MKRHLKKLLPAFVFEWYHLVLAYLAAFHYGFPSEKLIVIGVTGTNGKSTVCNLIARLFDYAGFKVGMTTTVNFRVAEREWLNDTKMTMLGRFRLQKLLADMVAAGCRYAIIETSSEGIKQHRHAAINYDAAVFTNLTPEHIESHGGFDNYKAAKGELFAKLGRERVKVFDDRPVPKVGIINLRDPHAAYYLGRTGVDKIGYLAELPQADGGVAHSSVPIDGLQDVIKAIDVELSAGGSKFRVRGEPFELKLAGGFNVENALAAVAVASAFGLDLAAMSRALAKVEGVPGRLEFIDAGQPFSVLVDYAPEPESFRKLYEVLSMFPKKRVIHVLGSTGGGRDIARRPILGELAAKNADVVIVTNEDPYDDDPMTIIRDVAAGAEKAGKTPDQDLFLILDRGEALTKAVALAEPGDLVVVTGNGAEQARCVAGGKKIPWDDRSKLREAIAGRPAR